VGIKPEFVILHMLIEKDTMDKIKAKCHHHGDRSYLIRKVLKDYIEKGEVNEQTA